MQTAVPAGDVTEKEEFEMLNRTKLLLATTALVAIAPNAPAMAEAPQGFALDLVQGWLWALEPPGRGGPGGRR